MRAVHINPHTQEVREVQLDDQNPVRSVVELLGGGPSTLVHISATVRNGQNGDTLYVDDSVDPTVTPVWLYLYAPLVGHGVIVGRNFSEDAEVPLERAQRHTTFDLVPVVNLN